METLEPLSEDRKCFRLINGVLVERTVKDVVPALKTNQEGLKKVLDDMVKQYKSKQDELDKWKVWSSCSRVSKPGILTYFAEKAQCSGRSPMIAVSRHKDNTCFPSLFLPDGITHEPYLAVICPF